MDKITYLAQLAEGLARWVPERERQDILRYYAEYFQEAGEEREAEVVAELGDPWALSCRLAVEGGFVTQEQANSWTPRQNKRKVWPVVTVAIVAVVAIIAILAAQLASAVGRFVGQTVADKAVIIGSAEAETGISVVEGEEWGFFPVEPVPSVPPVTSYIIEDNVAGGFYSMEDGWLEAFDKVDVDVGLGNVTITGGEDYTLFIQQSADFAGCNLTWEVTGKSTLKIRDSSRKNVEVSGLKDLFGDHGVDIVITVPEGALVEKVQVKTGLGDVFVSNLDAEKVEAETGLGDVECYEVRQAKKIDLESGVGDVAMGIDELWSGLEIDLEAGTGSVEANLNCTEGECAYELKSGLGNVTVNGASRGSKAERKGGSYELDVESGLGDVNVYFQDDRW